MVYTNEGTAGHSLTFSEAKKTVGMNAREHTP